jgi:hypothetical protein
MYLTVETAAMQDAEFESAVVTCEPAQKTTTAKRRRAAEVHNLSERVRRIESWRSFFKIFLLLTLY